MKRETRWNPPLRSRAEQCTWASATGEVLALDLQTGKLRWKYKAGEGIGESSPAVANGVVYIGDLDGTIHAINAADGKPRWKLKTAGEIKSSPVVVSGKVLIGSYDGNLYAVDAAKGELAWQYKTKAQVHATPAVANGLAFISGCDGILRAIRIADGQQAYQVEIGSYTGASPAIEGQNAYFGTFNNEVVAASLQRRNDHLAVRASGAQVSVLCDGGGMERQGLRRRPRQDDARSRCENRQGVVEFHDEGPHRFFACGHAGRPALVRFE